MRTATKQEAINGNSNDTVITPLRLKQVLANADINPGEGGGSSDAPVYTAGEGISITNNVITNTITNTSQLTNDSNFITEEEILDPVPVNSIFDYEGDTVPDGFIEIDEEDTVVEEVALSVTKPTNGEDIWVQTSANLFIPKQTYFGSYIKSDGSLGAKSDDRYWINDYLEIEPSTVYTFSRKNFGAGYHAWYDANKNLISTFNQVNNAVTTATSPSNAKYIRLSLYSGTNGYDDDLDTFQFVKGTTLPEYSKGVDGTKVYAKKADGTYEEIYNSKEVVEQYNLPVASSSVLGGIKVGQNLTIDEDGTLNAQAGGSADLTGYVKEDNLKTINGQSLIGTGNINIGGGTGSGSSEVYSLEETVIGTWLGKTLYRKVIDFGYMPNKTNKRVYHNIQNLEQIVTLRGFCSKPGSTTLMLPNPHSSESLIFALYANSEGQVVVEALGGDRSEYYTYIILEYTKTTN